MNKITMRLEVNGQEVGALDFEEVKFGKYPGEVADKEGLLHYDAVFEEQHLGYVGIPANKGLCGVAVIMGRYLDAAIHEPGAASA